VPASSVERSTWWSWCVELRDGVSWIGLISEEACSKQAVIGCGELALVSPQCQKDVGLLRLT
jgi:hypothetical protein